MTMMMITRLLPKRLLLLILLPLAAHAIEELDQDRFDELIGSGTVNVSTRLHALSTVASP
jgi:hypothetical protein